MTTKRYGMVGTLVCVGLGLALSMARGQIPTLEERILNSSLNPSNNTWTAQDLRIWPMPTETKGVVACYRYDFELSAKPRQATISLQTGTPKQQYWIFINGQLVTEPMLPKLRGGIRTLDLTPYLRSGHNVFAFKSDDVYAGHGVHLLAEGMIFCEDGSVMRLITDKTWRGGWNLPAGWEKPETDPKNLPPAEAMRRSPGRTGCLPHYIGPIQVAPVGLSQPLFDAEKPVELAVTVLNGAVCGDEQKSGNIEHRTPNTERRTNTETQASSISAEGGSASGGNHKPLPILTYEIFDENNRKNVGQGTVELKPKGKLDLSSTLKCGPLPAGAYRIRLVMTAGTNEVDRRDYEVASIGKIEQRLVEGTSYEDGMDLKPVWTVDCTQEPEPGMFITGGNGPTPETKVVEGPLGKSRILSENRDYTWFAYRYKVKKLYAPHLVVIEWPDDVPRSMLAQVYELSTMFQESYAVKGSGWQRGETSFISVNEQPRVSGKMQKLHIIYWPNEEDASIHLWNVAYGAMPGLQPAAASRISVYEIANDLPALRIAEPTTSVNRRTTKAECGERMIGYHSERANIIPTTCYAGPLGSWFEYSLAGVNHPEFYRNWYTTTENLIKRMRFSGQNMYLLGHFMYDCVLYPSKKFMFEQDAYNGGDATRDYAGIILRMFGRNGMSMVSGIEYVQTAEVLAASSNTLEQVIREGAPTLYCMSKDAKLSLLHSSWAGLNYFHPRVQADLLTLVSELTDLYKEYPAWKGVSFILSRNFGPMMGCAGGSRTDTLDWGYEDYTIELFQKETGVKVPPFGSAQGGPAAGPDPERFGKRYDWLMANAKQKWIDWRCEQFTKLFRKMRDTLVKGRPDLKLYLLEFEPMNGTKQAIDLAGHYDDPTFMSQAVKMFGFDVETLRKEKGIVVSYAYNSPGTGCILGSGQKGWWELLHDATWHDLFANDGKGGAYVWSGIPHYGPYNIPKGKWIFEGAASRQGYFWPRYMSDAFVNVLIRSNPTWIPHTWMDVTESTARLHDLRLFSRAYRSLPDGKYERLAGNGLDFNIWVESTKKKDAEYAYAANPHWWDLDEVTLEFAPGIRVHDLIKDQPVTLKDNKWSFRLGPYEVQTFRVEKGRSGKASAVVGAAVKVGKGPIPFVSRSVSDAAEVAARARAKEAELRDFPGWQSVVPLENMISQMAAYYVSGDVMRAAELAASWSLCWRKSQVVARALEAMPFLALGPFGDPKDVEEKTFFDVAPGYRGMETPYIGEFSGTNWDSLAAGLTPDLAKSFTVYPDKPAHWQPVVKTEYISFLGVCHSEAPYWMVAYAYTEIFSPEERDGVLLAGSDHAMWVWMNGKLALKYGGSDTLRGGQHPSKEDQYKAPIRLTKGWNPVLVKVVQRGETRIFFRLTDSNGKPMDDLKFRASNAG